ncbi:NAD(P)H-binding protein [Planococcus sp. CPCC 101016]|uniref:NAD(P)H-binding protein n=1 Tax=Planococcus sp. CPCC 101016 TaxID=2599617 RepID=UPI0021BDA673|nr:NAD(P)H-binding protein [Planococcus sp. CPCC 101016]
MFRQTPSKLEVTHEKLSVVKGDAFNPAEVAARIASHDAVVSSLGSNQGMKKSTEFQEMVKNIVTGMEEHDVKRIVCTPLQKVYPKSRNPYRVWTLPMSS